MTARRLFLHIRGWICERHKKPVNHVLVCRGLPDFAQAYQKGTATDPLAYRAAHAELLGIIKRERKRDPLPALRDLTTPEKA